MVQYLDGGERVPWAGMPEWHARDRLVCWGPKVMALAETRQEALDAVDRVRRGGEL